ncbi:hypothetical protein MTO96_002010 [Rhipicephalus appendiculatus]
MQWQRSSSTHVANSLAHDELYFLPRPAVVAPGPAIRRAVVAASVARKSSHRRRQAPAQAAHEKCRKSGQTARRLILRRHQHDDRRSTLDLSEARALSSPKQATPISPVELPPLFLRGLQGLDGEESSS